VLKSGSLILLEPSWSAQACIEIAFTIWEIGHNFGRIPSSKFVVPPLEIKYSVCHHHSLLFFAFYIVLSSITTVGSQGL